MRRMPSTDEQRLASSEPYRGSRCAPTRRCCPAPPIVTPDTSPDMFWMTFGVERVVANGLLRRADRGLLALDAEGRHFIGVSSVACASIFKSSVSGVPTMSCMRCRLATRRAVNTTEPVREADVNVRAIFATGRCRSRKVNGEGDPGNRHQRRSLAEMATPPLRKHLVGTRAPTPMHSQVVRGTRCVIVST